MGRLSASMLVLALSAVAALGLTACGSGGSDDLLPGDTASEINSNLDQVERLASEEDCVGAEDAAQAVSSQVEALAGVDAKLKQALREGATRLNELVAGCEEEETVEETVPSIEPAEELEEGEEEEKEKPTKPEKPDKEEEEAPEEPGGPSLPPQANGEAKGHEKQEEEVPPPVESGGGTPSGGVGPATPAGSE